MPDDVWIGAEIALPDFVTKESNLLRAGLVVFRGEIASQDRGNTHDAKEILGHITTGVTDGVVLVGDVDGRAVEVGRHHGEGLLRRAQIFVILRGRNVTGAVVVLVVRRPRINETDTHQLLGMRKGEAAEDKRIDDGELRRHSADAERENGHRKDAEYFLFNQNAKADADVLKEGF